MNKALLLIGTRPELIKCAPLICEFSQRGRRDQLIVVNTAQHHELLLDTLRFFNVEIDYTLDLMVPGQSLNELCARALFQFQNLLKKLKEEQDEPALIIAQGDTATTFAAALTAFHNHISFAHMEAGLRTSDYENPFPEEYYRRVISLHAQLYFAPTIGAMQNLVSEKIDPSRIKITGNTAVDAISMIRKLQQNVSEDSIEAKFGLHPSNIDNLVLVTCHRRENAGDNFEKIVQCISELAAENQGYHFVWVKHLNPLVKEKLENSRLKENSNLTLVEPLDYFEMMQVLPFVKLLITDSGGLQEEAPSFGIPVLVLREATERIESIEEGYALLCGADEKKIRTGFEYFVRANVSITHNPYGDGKAAVRICDHLCQMLDSKNVDKEDLAA